MIHFNYRDLYARYRLFKQCLAVCGVTDADCAQIIIAYYVLIDELWFNASTKLRRMYSLSDDCVRRLFVSVRADWLLRFLQGDEEIVGERRQVTVVCMRKSKRKADGVVWPLLKLGIVTYQIVSGDTVTSSWVEGASCRLDGLAAVFATG